MIRANDPQRISWVNISSDSDFSIQNIPFGVFRKKNGDVRVGTRIGDDVVDLFELVSAGLLKGIDATFFMQDALNPLMKITGKSGMRELRNDISDLLEESNADLRDNAELKAKAMFRPEEVEMLLPIRIGDYTDFYSSEQHAYNVGCMFRDPNNALLPNWKHIPVGYHGRSSSIIVSGMDIHRPKGQTRPNDEEPPVFGPCKLLDFELEMGFITFDGKPLGQSISTTEADEYIFGMVLFNDWSARDIQKWEYVPLGPFLAKNFASSMAPWIITLDALEPFRVAGEPQNPEVLPYLKFEGDKNIDIALEVIIKPDGGQEKTLSNSNYRNMYWNMCQQLAHHTVNGCDINVGDMMASGTISGKKEGSFGSMLEISWKGTKPVQMPDGTERRFINDGDTVTMRGHASKNGIRVGFGEVSTKVLPAI